MRKWRKWEKLMLKDKIKSDLNEALKKGDEIKCSTLRMLLAAILNREKEKKYKEKLEEDTELTDEEMIDVISSEAKKRKESIIEYEKGERQSLAEKEKEELEILEKYLPEQLSEEEVEKLAKETVEEVGAQNIKDMGKVMAELMPKLKGRAEGGLVSKIVKELLE